MISLLHPHKVQDKVYLSRSVVFISLLHCILYCVLQYGIQISTRRPEWKVKVYGLSGLLFLFCLLIYLGGGLFVCFCFFGVGGSSGGWGGGALLRCSWFGYFTLSKRYSDFKVVFHETCFVCIPILLVKQTQRLCFSLLFVCFCFINNAFYMYPLTCALKPTSK